MAPLLRYLVTCLAYQPSSLLLICSHSKEVLQFGFWCRVLLLQKCLLFSSYKFMFRDGLESAGSQLFSLSRFIVSQRWAHCSALQYLRGKLGLNPSKQEGLEVRACIVPPLRTSSRGSCSFRPHSSPAVSAPHPYMILRIPSQSHQFVVLPSCTAASRVCDVCKPRWISHHLSFFCLIVSFITLANNVKSKEHHFAAKTSSFTTTEFENIISRGSAR